MRSFDKATDNLLKWAAREDWAPRHMEIFAVHFAPMFESFGSPDEAVAGLSDEGARMLEVFIVEDFFTARFGEDGELNVIDDYLKRRGWREPVPARRYLRALRDSVVSLYEVVDLVPGRRMTVRDLIRGGEAVTVHEKLGSQNAAPWDRLAARVVAVNAKRYFTGAVLHLRYDLSCQLLEAFEKMAGGLQRDIRRDLRRRGDNTPVTRAMAREAMLRFPNVAPLLTQFWLMDAMVQAPAPEVRNTDDEAWLLCEVRLPVEGDGARVAEALDGLDGFEREEAGEARWRWLAPGSPWQRTARHREGRGARDSGPPSGTTTLGHAEMTQRTLVLSVNSKERAERGNALLAAHLGGLVGPALIAYQDPEKKLEEQAGTIPDEPAPPTEEALQVMHTYLDEHYRRTLDEPLPMLDGQTLREAASTRKGRGRVIDWLKQLENVEHRRAGAQQGYRPYDTSWLWRELGIEAPR